MEATDLPDPIVSIIAKYIDYNKIYHRELLTETRSIFDFLEKRPIPKNIGGQFIISALGWDIIIYYNRRDVAVYNRRSELFRFYHNYETSKSWISR